jgi:predicted glycoside hydrolase/deacetylase ChbG (UPF0249 family)
MVNAIVVNADDLGVSRGATLGIVKAHLEGVVTSASLAPSGADYQYAVAIVRKDCPDLGVGLHFTLSAGKPVSSPTDVPLLVDQRAYFKWEFVSLFRTLGWKKDGKLLEQIEIELEAQIQQLHADGIQPDHIDSERHIHLIPDIFERIIIAANRHGIPFVRAGNDFSMSLVRLTHFKPAVLRGGLIKFALLQGLTRLNRRRHKNLVSCDNFASYVFTGRLDLVLKDILQKTPDGVTEIMVHPGIPEESEDIYLANPGLEQYLKLEDRRLELNACLQARQFVEGLNLCNYKSLADQQTSKPYG